MANEKAVLLIKNSSSFSSQQKDWLLNFINTAEPKIIEKIIEILEEEKILQTALIDFVNKEKLKITKKIIQEFETKNHEKEIAEALNLIKTPCPQNPTQTPKIWENTSQKI